MFNKMCKKFALKFKNNDLKTKKVKKDTIQKPYI